MQEEKKKKQNYNFHFSMEDKEAELWWEWVGSRYGGDPDYSKWNYNANMDKDLIEVLKLNKDLILRDKFLNVPHVGTSSMTKHQQCAHNAARCKINL